MNQFRKTRHALLAVMMVSALLGACQRRSDTGQMSSNDNSSRMESSGTSSAGSSAAGSESSGSGSRLSDAGAKAGQTAEDSIITTKAKSALLADRSTKGTEIHVETNKGVVTLSGNVDSSNQMSRAESIVKNLDGVKSVENNLSVKKQQ